MLSISGAATPNIRCQQQSGCWSSRSIAGKTRRSSRWASAPIVHRVLSARKQRYCFLSYSCVLMPYCQRLFYTYERPCLWCQSKNVHAQHDSPIPSVSILSVIDQTLTLLENDVCLFLVRHNRKICPCRLNMTNALHVVGPILYSAMLTKHLTRCLEYI